MSEKCYTWDKRIEFIVRYMYGKLKKNIINKSKFDWFMNHMHIKAFNLNNFIHNFPEEKEWGKIEKKNDTFFNVRIEKCLARLYWNMILLFIAVYSQNDYYFKLIS